VGNFCGQATQCFAIGIDQEPVPFYSFSFGAVSFHRIIQSNQGYGQAPGARQRRAMIQKTAKSDKHFCFIPGKKRRGPKDPRENHQREDGGVKFCLIK
jgi:hypothetical protein